MIRAKHFKIETSFLKICFNEIAGKKKGSGLFTFTPIPMIYQSFHFSIRTPASFLPFK